MSSSVCSVDQASTTWMCVSTLLVLGMSPALALFESGMLRAKNSISVITQILCGVMVLSVMWFCFGYSLTFGKSQGGVIGNLNNAFYIGVSYSDCSWHAPSIPAALFATFQMMFAVITPLLMTGGLAERMKFKPFMLFLVLWQIIIYYPTAHIIWGGGFLTNIVYDFAGGIVIHASAGVGSLVCAMYLGRRKDFFNFMGEFPPSNLPLATTGTALLWIGWFGFNGGSAFQSGAIAVSAIVSTQIGCSCGAFTWMLLSWYYGKPQAAALMNGALAGLAGITPASGYINSQESILVGFICGIASYYSVILVKHKFHIDDALDVSSVHGLTGIIGALAIGFFADPAISLYSGPSSILTGRPIQLANQIGGIAFVVAWSGLWTYIILRVVDFVHGGKMRATEEEEELGLDWVEHAEVAYHRLQVLNDDVVPTETPEAIKLSPSPTDFVRRSDTSVADSASLAPSSIELQARPLSVDVNPNLLTRQATSSLEQDTSIASSDGGPLRPPTPTLANSSLVAASPAPSPTSTTVVSGPPKMLRMPSSLDYRRAN